jgi:uncharacterized RDD family membrane protein YckC
MKSEPVYGSFIMRLAAVIVDSLILLPITGLLYGTIGLFYETVLSLIIAGAYYTAFVSGGWQATPGKRLIGVYVVRIDGAPLKPKEALERYLGYLLPSLPLYSSLEPSAAQGIMLWLSVVWFMPIALTAQKTGLHDILCRTRVIKGRPDEQ